MAEAARDTDVSLGSIGVVVIGRNEGARMVACLESLGGSNCPVVYVDSGSSDGSSARAATLCDQVVELDPARPFSAARARNEGFAALRALRPEVGAVQFVDADCAVQAGWLRAAAAALSADERCAVVVGGLLERRPEASIYNRLCALEWRSPPGELTDVGALGGIMMVRARVFESLGGFNASVIAGEDSEFGVRARAAGFSLRKLAEPMATHDADMHRFSQWWRRAVRSGHAIGQRYAINGTGPLHDCAKQRRSVLVWGVAVPLLVVVLLPVTRGASVLLLGAYLLLIWRVARFRRSRGDSRQEARLYAGFTAVGKFAEALGLLRYHVARMRGQYRILEYK